MARALISVKVQHLSAKDFQALTSAGTKDRREEFSKLLTRLVRTLEREKDSQKLPGNSSKPGAQHPDRSELLCWSAAP